MGKKKSRQKNAGKPMQKPRATRDYWPWIIFSVAVALRLLHVVFILHLPFFDAPVIDAEMYDTRAMNMLQGITPDKIFYQAPLYSIFLAGIYFVFGHNFIAVRIIQALMGAASCALVYVIGKKVFDERAGRIAGLAAALYGPMIYYDAEVLRPVLVIFLALLMLWALLKWQEEGVLRWAAAAGVLLGLSAITRENILIFAPVAAGFMFFRAGERRFDSVVILTLAAALAILPVTIRNYIVEDDFVPVSPQGGMNFYIGNSVESDRLTALQPGIDWDRMSFMPRDYLGEDAKPSEYSSWFFARTFEDIAAAPGRWVRHMCRKFALFWTGEELAPNADLELYRQTSPVLRVLQFGVWRLFIPFGLLVPLFAVGIYAARPLDGKKWLLLSFVLAYMISVVLFHVRARYRIPVVPAMLPFAAHGALWLWESIKTRRQRAVAVGLAVFVLAAVFAAVPWTDTSFAHGYPTHYFLAKAYVKKGDDRAALPEFEQAVNHNPNYAELRHDYGQALIRVGRVEDGVAQVEAARELAPDCAFIHKNLGQMYRKKADRLRASEKSMEESDMDLDAPDNSAAAQQFVEAAIKEYEAAQVNDKYDTSIKYDLALLYEVGGYKGKFRLKLKEYIDEAKDKPGEKEWVRIARTLMAKEGAEETGETPAGNTQYTGQPEQPATATDHLNMAQAYMRGDNLERATNELQAALELDPANSGAYSLLGNIYKKTNRPADAEKAYLRALEIDPANLLAHNNLANLYRDSGRFAEAAKHYDRALELAPENVVIIKNRTKMLEMMK